MLLLIKHSYYIVNVVNTGLAEAGTSTTYLYYLVFIFSSFFWRVSELIILAIIIRTIAETGILSKIIKPANILAIVVLAVLSAASYGIYVANTVDIIRNGPYSIDDDNYLDLQLDQWHVSLAYQVVYLLVSIVAGIVGLLAIFKERSKVYFSFRIHERSANTHYSKHSSWLSLFFQRSSCAA